MKIALNATIADKTRTGIGHYAVNLSKELLRRGTDHKFIVYCQEEMKEWFESNGSGQHEIVSCRFQSRLQRIFWEQTKLWSDLKSRGVELLHSMAFTSPLFRSMKSVVTVHDLAFLKYPKTIPLLKRLYYRPVFKRSLLQAEKIITISETMKEEIIEYFNFPEEKVVAIPLAANEDFRRQISGKVIAGKLQQLNITFPYLLIVGTLEPRKNLPMLLNAFRLLKETSDLPHRLVVVGKKGWFNLNSPELNSFIEHSGTVLFTGYVEQDAMPELFAGADLFLFPSLYEGFGLPLLEAFACGTPVVASDIAVFREIAGEAAVFVVPKNPELWNRAIGKLLGDKTRQNRLVSSGLARLENFSWKNTATATLNVYGMN